MAPKEATNSDSSSTLQRVCAARKAGMMRRGVPTNSTRSCQGATIQREEGCRLCAVAPDETDRATILLSHPSTAQDERSSRARRRMRAPHHIVRNTSEAELTADLEEPPLQHVNRLEPRARGRERERGVLPVDPVAVEHVVNVGVHLEDHPVHLEPLRRAQVELVEVVPVNRPR